MASSLKWCCIVNSSYLIQTCGSLVSSSSQPLPPSLYSLPLPPLLLTLPLLLLSYHSSSSSSSPLLISSYSLLPILFQILGKVGRVVDVYSDGDLQVEITGVKWTFNPKNVSMLEGDGPPLTPDTSGKSLTLLASSNITY